MPTQRDLLKNLVIILLALGFICSANSSEATSLSGYNDLVLLYTKGFSEDEQAAFKNTIQKMDQDALNYILKKELNSTFSERQYIFRQSESTPTRIFHFNEKYTIIGFEKTLHYKGSWVKSAYMLLFENKGPQHLNYTNNYLFWKGKNSVEDYKSISVGLLCSKFALLSQMADCGKDDAIQIAQNDSEQIPPQENEPPPQSVESQNLQPVPQKIEPPKPQAPPEKAEIPKPKKTVIAAAPKEEKTTRISNSSRSSMDSRLMDMDVKLRNMSSELERKADKKHTHDGRDITSGILKESFIDAAIMRDRELAHIPERVTYGEAEDAYINNLENRVMELENSVKKLTALLEGVTRDQNNLLFSGLNVQIVNGTGSTNGAVNGLGNLIVGYNQARDGADEIERTGSHNLIVGDGHDYKSYGGFVAGLSNTISGAYSSVSGGLRNVASGDYSAVSGGHFKTAEGLYALSQPDAVLPEPEEKESRACFLGILSGRF